MELANSSKLQKVINNFYQQLVEKFLFFESKKSIFLPPFKKTKWRIVEFNLNNKKW